MSDIRLFNLDDKEDWTEHLERLPQWMRDVYYTPEYHQLYENHGDGKARCFVFSDQDDYALYPFFLNRINDLGYNLPGDFFDVQGVYGYNGIVTSSQDHGFLIKLKDAWLDWVRSNNIVAEFTRFNPVHRNENLCLWAHPIDALDNVLIELFDYDTIWQNSYDRGVRNALRKCADSGMAFRICVGDEISEGTFDKFTQLYLSTMDRREADSFYYFDSHYFEHLYSMLRRHLLLVWVEFEDKIISSDLYFANGVNAYGFISGTLKEYFHMKANTFLRDQTIKALIGLGYRNYSIGGGLTRGDSVFKYKKSFSKNHDSIFYIGKAIHNQEVYDSIIDQWMLKIGEGAKKYRSLLLKYRYMS
jgi:hypothetical protein